MRDELEPRVRRLERRLRATTALLAGAVLAGVLVAARAPAFETLRAGRFELVDEQGRVLAELAVDDEGSAGFFLRDTAARVRAALVHDDQQTGLFLFDEEGTVRVGAAQYAHGGGGFALHGPESAGGAVLYLKGEGSLTFYDAEGGEKRCVPE